MTHAAKLGRARVRLALLALLLGAASVQAQTPSADSAALVTIAEHLDAARFDSARSALEAWQSTRAASARERERAAATMLAARLERDGQAAQDAWLSLALAHPFSADAGLALLRVGQAAVLRGDTASAFVYLARLIDDFPGSGHGAEAHLWLSRAQHIAGRPTAACASARAGLAAGTSAEVLGLLRLQEQRACAAVEAAPPTSAPDRPAATGRFAVQTGAFRGRAGADALIARLREADLQPRLVRVPTNELMRVRVGAFTARAEAAALRDRLIAAGFDAVVVADANQETRVP